MKEVRRLGVLGDVHAEHHRLEAALDRLSESRVDAIICTGDLVDGTGCPNSTVRQLQSYGVITVRGNHDRWILQDKARHIVDAHHPSDLDDNALGFLATLPTQVSIRTVRGPLLLCHGIAENDLKKVWPGTERMEIERSRDLDQLIDEGHYTYVINGHMHFRTLIHFSNLTLINAGTLRGEYSPGFSVIDFDTETIMAYEFKGTRVHRTKQHAMLDESHTVWPSTREFSGGWDPVRLF